MKSFLLIRNILPEILPSYSKKKKKMIRTLPYLLRCCETENIKQYVQPKFTSQHKNQTKESDS